MRYDWNNLEDGEHVQEMEKETAEILRQLRGGFLDREQFSADFNQQSLTKKLAAMKLDTLTHAAQVVAGVKSDTIEDFFSEDEAIADSPLAGEIEKAQKNFNNANAIFEIYQEVASYLEKQRLHEAHPSLYPSPD